MVDYDVLLVGDLQYLLSALQQLGNKVSRCATKGTIYGIWLCRFNTHATDSDLFTYWISVQPIPSL
jgi:hypothetical protein